MSLLPEFYRRLPVTSDSVLSVGQPVALESDNVRMIVSVHRAGVVGTVHLAGRGPVASGTAAALAAVDAIADRRPRPLDGLAVRVGSTATAADEMPGS